MAAAPRACRPTVVPRTPLGVGPVEPLRSQPVGPGMPHDLSRRGFLATQSAAAICIVGVPASVGLARQSAGSPDQPAQAADNWPGFPQQDPALAREIVGASHANPARVKELLAAHPALAKASYDWGYGDWESALGAASHTGNREIAEMLLAAGARLDIFAAAMLGMTETVKSMIAARPALAATLGPHGIPLFAHAEAGEAKELVEFLGGLENPIKERPKSLAADESGPFLGTFAREDGRGEIIISQARAGMMIRGKGGGDVRLIPTGKNTFYPVGANNVRVTFTIQDGIARRIEIVEAPWMVSAMRQ